MILGIPNSPRWLLLRGNDEAKAKKLLQQLDPLANVEERIKAIKNLFSGNKLTFSQVNIISLFYWLFY